MTEIWAKIHMPEFPEYEVSNLGSLRRVSTFKRRSPRIGAVSAFKKDEGYLKANLHTRRTGLLERKQVFVHVLVARAHVAGYEAGMQVHHKNEDKGDARAENLQWVTPAQNRNLISPQMSCLRRSISYEEIVLLRRAHEIGLGVRQLARAFGIQASYVSRIVRGLVR